MHYHDSRWRPRCQGKSRDDVSGRMPKNIRNLTVCSTLCFKKKLDLHLSTIPDFTPNLSNSLDTKYKL